MQTLVFVLCILVTGSTTLDNVYVTHLAIRIASVVVLCQQKIISVRTQILFIISFSVQTSRFVNDNWGKGNEDFLYGCLY